MSRTYATPAAIITISILFPVLGTLTVILRFYTRRKTKSVLWIDDWLTLPALGLEYVLAALLLWGTTTGSLGGLLPQPDDPRPDAYIFSNSDQQIRLLQIQYVADIVTVWAFGFTKLSILYFYRSIFCSRRTIRTAFHSVTMCMTVLVSVWTVAFGVGTIFICGAHPVNAWGTIAVVTTECTVQVPIVEGYAISDFIMDVIIWLLPLPRIWLLNISVRQKMALGLVFLVGLLAIAASATRMAIYIAHHINPFAQSDGENLLFWTMIECGLGVIVICLPSLRPMYKKRELNSLINSFKRYLYRIPTSTTSSALRNNSLNGLTNSNSSNVNLVRPWHPGPTTSPAVGHNASMAQHPSNTEQRIQVTREIELIRLDSS
ncbi:uncharacterized protein BO96DRAFT_245300 [Aspergillus niger CBS 101883]|uniref:uncharacterized protein n=1 Tax=Aspergillus lacticoffeatus (strain CBS 101883) TaxID=1450533 RepID=UPI000D7FECC4|nr:uncharacterized protein BO96DRAFT_245300 [Aspergillus niger CBS 101883]PYH58625.1 hypothetical protein BO96DRAFT_245300 [Aspergillus niger CBS 101883]